MDPDVEIMHVIENKIPVSEKQMQVMLSQNFNRRKDSPTEQNSGSQFIEDVWNKRLQDNPRLFNKTKFRIHEIKKSNSTNTNEKGKLVDIHIGVTDYKEYLGTNWSPKVLKLKEEGDQLHNNSQIFLSDALGVGAFVITKDRCMILQKRSAHLAEAANLWDVPGGHAEPSELVGNLILNDIDVSQMNPESVAREIFSSISKEVVDEVNIPITGLEPPLYLGTARNTTSAGRPSLVFEIKTSLSNNEVIYQYDKGSQPEADESTSLTFIPIDEIPGLRYNKPEFWSQLAPSAKGNITVYCLAYGL